jgi:hypothetical protein
MGPRRLKVETEAECRERCERVRREIAEFDKAWRAQERARIAAMLKERE